MSAFEWVRTGAISLAISAAIIAVGVGMAFVGPAYFDQIVSFLLSASTLPYLSLLVIQINCRGAPTTICDAEDFSDSAVGPIFMLGWPFYSLWVFSAAVGVAVVISLWLR